MSLSLSLGERGAVKDEESMDAEGSAEGLEMCAETSGLVTMLESASEMVSRRSGMGGLGRGHVFCPAASGDSSCVGDRSTLGVREFSLLVMCSEGSFEGGGVGMAAWVDTSEGDMSCGGVSQIWWFSMLDAAAGGEEDCDLCSGRAMVLVAWGADREGAGAETRWGRDEKSRT